MALMNRPKTSVYNAAPQRPMQRGVTVSRIVPQIDGKRAFSLAPPMRKFTRASLSDDQLEVFGKGSELSYMLESFLSFCV